MSTATKTSDELADELLMWDEEIAELTERLSHCKASRAACEEALLERWIEHGKQSESRRGKTLYKSRELLVSTAGGRGPVLRELLTEQFNMGEFVRPQVSIQGLKSWLKEACPVDPSTGERDFSAIPQELLDCLNVHEQFRVRVRTA